MSFKSDRYLGNPGTTVEVNLPLSSSIDSTSETTAATSKAVKALRDKTELDKTEVLVEVSTTKTEILTEVVANKTEILAEVESNKTELLTGIDNVSTQLDETKAETSRIDEFTVKINKDLTTRGFNILNFISEGETTHSDAFQRANDYIREKVLSSTLSEIPSLRVPAGTYVIDKTVIMSPYLKIKSEGTVRFNVTVNGIAFHITPSADDPRFNTQSTANTYNYVFNKNAWNRGKYFDGSNGGFLFTTQLDRATSNTVAIAIGKSDMALKDDMRPTSRYVLEQVNIFGFRTALKHYAVDNYIGFIKNCHMEGNYTHMHWALPDGITERSNGGENQVYEGCVFAQATGPSFIFDGPGADFTFENSSFDFNASPMFKVNRPGTFIRVNDAHIEGIRVGADGERLILEVDNPLTSSQAIIANERNAFYMKNCIVMLAEPSVLVKNNTNATSGARIKLLLDMDGIETRHGLTMYTDPYALQKKFFIKDTENIQLYSHKVFNGSLLKSSVSPGINLVSNHNFEKSVNNAVIVTNTGDDYWEVENSTNATNVVIAPTDGIGSTKCLKYDISDVTNNILRFANKHSISVEPGDVLHTSLFLKTDVINSTAQIIHRLTYYDAFGSSLGSVMFYDFLTDSSTNVTNDATKFRMTRGMGSFLVPSGAVKAKLSFSLTNMPGTVVYIDDIHLSKSK